MKRYVHNLLAALLCVCLLVSYTPLPASADETAGSSVGEPGQAQTTGPNEAQATTTVSVLAVGLTIAGKTHDVTASVGDILKDAELPESERLYVLKVLVEGADAAACDYAWTRSVAIEDGSWAKDETFAEDASAQHSLADDALAGLLESGRTYRYSVEVGDPATGQSASASIVVTISDDYLDRTLVHAGTGVSVSGALLRSFKDDGLGVQVLDASSAAYGFLEQAADGMRLASAWQLALVSDGGHAPFSGSVEVSLPVNEADGTQVSVVSLSSDGKTSVTRTIVKDGCAVVEVSALGAFAVALPAPRTFTVTASAGEGGSVSPVGAKSYAEGAEPSYVFLPDEGYDIGEVSVDGEPVAVEGNAYRFAPLAANHELRVAFEKVQPVVEEYTVTVRVIGGNGRVSIDAADPSVEQAVKVEHGGSARVSFAPDDGYVVNEVTVREGDGEPRRVTTFGDGFLLSAIQADTTVEVAYRSGVTPPIPVHSVTASVASGEGSVSPERVEVSHGGNASFLLVPAQGWRILRATVDGSDVSAQIRDGVLVLQNVVEDHAVSVAFEKIPRTFVVEASATTGGTITPSGSVKVKEGDDARFAFAPDEGFRLTDVLLDGRSAIDEVADGVFTLGDVRENHTVCAVFEALPPDPPELEYVTVHASAGPHGKISPAGDQRVEEGADVEFSLIPDEGYVVDGLTVDGWDVDASLYADGTYTLLGAYEGAQVRVTFRPGDTPVEVFHVVSASASSGGVISPAGEIQVKEGASASFFVSADYGYRLAKLLVDGEEVAFDGTAYVLEDVRSDRSVRAEFERVADDPQPPSFVTVHASAGEGGSISPAGDVRVPYGATQAFTILSDEGWEVDAVTADGKPVAFAGSTVTLFDVKADATLTVSFKRAQTPQPAPVTHTVTAKAGQGGTISPAGTTTVAEGGSVLYALIPDEGYRVDVLTVDGVAHPGYEGSSYRLSDVTADHTIAVTFVKEAVEPAPTYVHIVASAGDGGAISPAGDVTLPKGGSQTFYFLPDEGKQVNAVTVDGKRTPFSGSSYTLFDVDKDASIDVEFVDVPVDELQPPLPVAHVVTASAGSGGAVSPEGAISVFDGGALLLAFVPDVGYEVDEVRVGGEVVQRGGLSYRLTDVRADAAVEVTFKRSTETDQPLVAVDVKVEVEAHAEVGTGGLVSPSGTLALAQGSSQTFHVFPEEGYDLDRVLVNGKEVQAEAVQPLPRMMFRSSGAVVGAAGGYRFTIESVTEDTQISVSFRELSEDEPAPAPVVSHEVRAAATSGGMISPSGSTWVAEGGAVSFTVKADAGWRLASLSVDGADVTGQVVGGSFKLAGVTGDADVRAVFEPKAVEPEPAPYATVHASASEGGSISPAGDVRVRTGGSQAFAFVPDEGFVLDKVTVDGNDVVPLDGVYTLFDIAADRDIRATFRAKLPEDPEPVVPETRMVTVSASAGGTASPLGSTGVVLGGSLLVTILPDEGFELERVELDGTDVTERVSDGALRLANVVEDHRVDVSFKVSESHPPAARHTVTAASSAGGSIDPAGVMEVEEGGSVSFDLAADEGFALKALTVDGRDVTTEVSDGMYVLADVRADVVVYAAFAHEGHGGEEPPAPPAAVHTLTARVDGGHGSVSPEGAVNVAEGADQTFFFHPDEGYVVGEVRVDGELVSWSPKSWTFEDVRADHELTVAFKPAPVAAPASNPSNPLEIVKQAAETLTKTGDAPWAFFAGMTAVAALTVAAFARSRRSRARADRR